LQTICISTALLVTTSDSKKKLELKHAFEGEREAAVGWVVGGRPQGWDWGWDWGGGDGVGAGTGREAYWVGAGVATRLLRYGCSGPCVFSNHDEGPS
jgi:hypothetical protein